MLTVFRAGALVDLGVREVVDSDLAPSVFALAIAHELDHASQRHRHASGQLYCLKQGVMVVGTETGMLANPPHFVGWIPPYFEHSIAGPGALEGWTVFVAQADCAGLPPQPALLSCSALLEPLVERLAGFAPTQWQQPEYQRVTAVLLDELRGAGIRAPSLPLPDERRLRAIATVLIDNPGDPRGGP
ncbi:MAG: HTH-type transcriptional regulator NimR [Stenotrophomonas maltophilia]|nr:MAG: HTH-type transcriptional regulator NimR [Stenotrophomonas maltophilia]